MLQEITNWACALRVELPPVYHFELEFSTLYLYCCKSGRELWILNTNFEVWFSPTRESNPRLPLERQMHYPLGYLVRSVLWKYNCVYCCTSQVRLLWEVFHGCGPRAHICSSPGMVRDLCRWRRQFFSQTSAIFFTYCWWVFCLYPLLPKLLRGHKPLTSTGYKLASGRAPSSYVFELTDCFSSFC